MIRWIPFELHTHTVHSDANHTLQEVAGTAQKIGLEGIALTDHNTIAGWQESEFVARETGIHILNGMEWTTFYGHMVVLGVNEYVDWRGLNRKNIHEGIQKVHDLGGIVGVAHPFRLGYPICTGGTWEFEVSDWNSIDYMEVWSNVFPPSRIESQRSYELWTELLNKGCRITGVSGRDWHSTTGNEEYIAVTYLGINTDCPEGFESVSLEALRSGRVCVTLGPLLHLQLETDCSKKVYGIGETAAIDSCDEIIKVSLSADFSARSGKWNLSKQGMEMVFMSNLGCIQSKGTSDESRYIVIPANGLKWLRGELYAMIDGIRTLAAFTNPIYLEKKI